MTYEIKYRNKEEMKDSDFEWLGKIPDDWHILKNKHIFKHRKKTYNKNENTKVLSLTIKGVKIKEDLSFGKSTESYIGHQLVKKDELIFTPRDFDATPILSGISPANGCISNLYFVLRTNELTTEKYVNWYWWGLKYGYDYFKEFSFGIRSSFNQEQFGDIPFLYTKITEQKKISNFLDYKTSQFDTIIEKKEKLIEKLEEAKKSLISEVVTGKVKIVDGKLVKRDESEMKDSGVEWLGKIPKDWEVKKLKYISECYPSNVDKKTKESEKEVKLCNYTDVYYNDYINKDIEFMKATASDRQIKKFQLKEGDIILTKDSESPDDIAVASYVREEIDNLICGYHLNLIRNIENNESMYVYFALLSEGAKSYFGSIANGITRYGISSGGFKNFNICLPRIDEQKIIIEYIKKQLGNNSKIKKQVKQQINLIKQAKQSLISEAVTGKIDLRD